MVSTKKTVNKKTPKTSRKSTVSTKKTISKSKKKKDTGVVKKNEKKELIGDLKTSMKSMGRLPGLMMAPVIAFVSKRYDTIPAQRRKSLKGITKKMKSGSSEGISGLKERFADTSKSLKKSSDTASKKVKSSASAKKKATKKKTAKAKKVAKKSTKKKAPKKTKTNKK